MARPRILVFPFPALGHVKPFLTLAELLSDGGVDVVFLSTEYNFRRIPKSNLAALAARFPTLHFATISDGLPLPPDHPRSLLDTPLYFTVRDGIKPQLRHLIRSYNAASSPITCVINDVMYSSPIEVAHEFGIPVFTFCPFSARYLTTYFVIPKLLEQAQIPYADENPVGEIQGMPLFEGLLRRNHLPAFWCGKTSDIPMSHSLINQTLSVAGTSALIINTFDDLEAPFLTHLSSIFDKIYTIGPIHALSKSRLGDSSSSPSALAGFWTEDRTCMSWLDSRPRRSVIFVGFGSLVKMKQNELTEIWHGLVNSGKPFACVLRPDVVFEGESESGQFIKQLVGERGNNGNWMVVEWAAQEKVLAHPAVGAFLTHCGWNSALESIVAGVPMMCWPSIGDQPSNSTWIEKVWKIGIERNQKWDRSTVEMMIRELIDGQKGMEIQRSVEKLSKLALGKVVNGGLSFNNLECLVQDLKNL